MTILLDTQLLLWSQVEPHRLPQSLIDSIETASEPPFFSIVSIWEVVIKSALNRPDFRHDPERLRATLLRLGWLELELTGNHVLAVANLTGKPGDPFDRALVAQAKVEGMDFVTTDKVLIDYGPHVRLVKGRTVKP
jgi:PIN domain nuclease of toxin-antitoxin system